MCVRTQSIHGGMNHYGATLYMNVCLNACIYLLVTRTWSCVTDQSHDWWLKKVYHNATDIVCIYLNSWCVCNVCASPVIFMQMKEGAGGSRWDEEDDVVVLYIKRRKGPARASRWRQGMILCVLNEGRGQREVGVKTGYEMGRVSWNKMCLFKLNKCCMLVLYAEL